MTDDDRPPTKLDLLEVIHTERTRLEALIEGLTDNQMTEVGVESSRSIKDILSHIAAWERLAFDRIDAALSGKPLKFPLIKGDVDVDTFNSAVYEKYKEQPISKVMAEFNDSHVDFLAQIEALDDDFLTNPLSFNWAGKLSAQVLVSANTHWHYTEHAESIIKWLENQA